MAHKTLNINKQNNNSNYIYRVQVGLFRNYNNALNLHNQLLMLGYISEIVSLGDLYGVHVGKFGYLDEAVVLEQILRRQGYNTLVVAI